MSATPPDIYMQRCIRLAQLGGGYAAPNPMVGAVLVHNDTILGEGYHQKWGGPHAEVNCIGSVKEADRHLIEHSTLYVSLEPCAHHGKTPPCADLIIRMKIRNVVIGCRDPFVEVDGKGIEKLKAAGVSVEVGVLEKECKALNRRFLTFHTKHRPYVILKWAQTTNGMMAGNQEAGRLYISNEYTNRIVHKWRSEEMAIAVGTNTARADDPALNTRLWPGKNPVRIVIDRQLRLPASLKLFDGHIPTIVFNLEKHTIQNEGLPFMPGVHYYRLKDDGSLVQQLLDALYHLGIQSVMIEGGAVLLQSFIEEGSWDETRIITNDSLVVEDGLPAPVLKKGRLVRTERIMSDTILYYEPAEWQ
jgi:diaminohydroxyphosphoribosylaminopyrimidine deaminase/5-amino-6-(5-phosphoribosylamino)uracil reductase